MQIGAGVGLHEQLRALATGEAHQQGRDGIEELNIAADLAARLASVLQKLERPRDFACLGAQQSLVDEGREARLLPLAEQLVREPAKVLTAQRDVERMIGILGLDQHFPLRLAATGASGDLGEQRIEAFGRPEVRAVEHAVRVEHANQREVRKVVALGEHLGADQDVDVARANALAHLVPGVLAARAVAVDPQHARLRKMAAERLFDALGALPHGRQIRLAALRAGRRDTPLVSAVVAMETQFGDVQNELRRTAIASRQPAAVATGEHGRVAPAIDENERLFLALEARFERAQEPRRRSHRPSAAGREGCRRFAEAAH